ncbi:MAG: dihydrofolate reductase [Prosthecobacter sp.]
MTQRPRVTLIAVVSADGFISQGHGVPWHLPRDKAHFRAATRGQWLLIGRTTYEEMLGWFRDDQHPLMLTRDKNSPAPVGKAVPSVEEALQEAQKGGAAELMVLGGGPTFSAAMPWADRLLVTHVASDLGSGVPFPPIPPEDWLEVERHAHPADAENPYPLVFSTYERRKSHPGKPV